MNRAVSAMMGTVTVLVVLAGCGTPLAGRYNDDSVPYRPSTAMVASSSDCLSTNIYTALTGLGPWDSALTPDAPQPGFPPSDFRPVAVLKCERGVDGDGFLTVDTVRLEGDVAAVDAAFSADSHRFPDGVMASCAYSMEPPAGLWFVDEVGGAIRPQWPATPCGLQDAPLAALGALTEVSRTSHPTGYNDRYSTVCEAGPETGFETTTAEDVATAQEAERAQSLPVAPTLAMPIDDVDALSLCTFSPRTVAVPYDSVAGTSATLSRASSAAVVRAVADAPIAEPCAQASSRISTTYLRRPDGSGTTPVSFELDGCHRASGFGYYRAIPAAALAILGQ